jgi:hypothetical protein
MRCDLMVRSKWKSRLRGEITLADIRQARERYYRSLLRACRVPPVSPTTSAIRPQHWRKSAAFRHGRRIPARDRLSAEAERIRPFSSAPDRQRFRAFVRVGADLPAHRSSEQLQTSAYRSSCRRRSEGPRSPPLTARNQASSHHGRVVGGAAHRGTEVRIRSPPEESANFQYVSAERR